MLYDNKRSPLKEPKLEERTRFRRNDKMSKRTSLRVMEWLRQKRIYRGIREVPYVTHEDESSTGESRKH